MINMKYYKVSDCFQTTTLDDIIAVARDNPTIRTHEFYWVIIDGVGYLSEKFLKENGLHIPIDKLIELDYV